MKLLVGLGNPGDKFEKSRHNLGFLVLDHFAKRHNFSIDVKKKKSLIGKMRFGNNKIVILKPQTFVNLSGEAVLYMASFLRIQPQDIILVCDDIKTPLGDIVVQQYGSSGGHNGIKSLIKFLKADNFPCIRIGIGPQDPSISLEDFVLGSFSSIEMERLESVFEKSCDIIEKILDGEISSLVRKCSCSSNVEEDSKTISL